MVTIYMNKQNKTNQITDWKLWCKDETELMLTVFFLSGKKFTLPFDQCEITPQNKLMGNLFSIEKNIYQTIETATEYGDRYTVVKFPNDKKMCVYESKDITICTGSNMKNEEIFNYFINVAQERIKNTTQKNRPIVENILRQLEKITPHPGTALHAYCYGNNSTRENLKHLIFPFGLNESQLQAVENAFSSQISIIEGPPGTGKTQTILNIMANILINKKSVAIVSNNNAAVENVYEKMSKYNLDYLIAKLGSASKKKAFFNEIKEIPDNDTLNKNNILIEEIGILLEKLKGHLNAQNKVAQLTAEISELKIEKQHLEEWHRENPLVVLKDLKKYKLNPKKTTDLMAYINYLSTKHLSFKDRFRLLINYKIIKTDFLNSTSELLNFTYSLYFDYYNKMLQNKEKELSHYKNQLEQNNYESLLEELTNDSMSFLKHQLTEIIPSSSPVFTLKNYKNRKSFNEFIKRFPVIGSSTHSIVNSIADGALLDYLIIDEASQQDIIPGILSLGCAKNIIIVGDRKQLPHIPEKSDIECPSEYYNCIKYSLLDSFAEIFKEKVPSTLLKEHYRCHPKIIQFCNQQFYDNQLIPMTNDNGEIAIQLITTSKGNHTRNFSNLRELESLQEVGWSDESDNGFIAPYNNQVNLAKRMLPKEYIKDTIHKFQGRECKEIIFSTVLDKKKSNQDLLDFVDNPSLVNVAVSRAINKFTLVTGNDVFSKNNQNIAALIRYIKYYAQTENIYDSPVISAFDLLYDEYDKSLERLNARLDQLDPQVKSEKIVSLLLKEILKQSDFNALKFHMQVDLIQLVSIKNNSFSNRELEFMRQKASCDFVLYYKVGKTPLGVIEVDGLLHGTTVQEERDTQKNSILTKVNIPLLRIKTIEGNIETKIESFVRSCISNTINK